MSQVPIVIMAQSLHGFEVVLFFRHLYRWGSNVKCSVCRQREVSWRPWRQAQGLLSHIKIGEGGPFQSHCTVAIC